MSTPSPYCVVLCTCPDIGTAETIAKSLVADRHAACVNIVPGLTSVYEWEGRVEQDPECLLVAKTSTERYAALERAVLERHPYELPEIISVPIGSGLSGYLAWIAEAVGER